MGANPGFATKAIKLCYVDRSRCTPMDITRYRPIHITQGTELNR
jgi:hypothetical protein